MGEASQVITSGKLTKENSSPINVYVWQDGVGWREIKAVVHMQDLILSAGNLGYELKKKQGDNICQENKK